MKKIIVFIISFVMIFMTACKSEEKVKIGILTKLEAGSIIGTSEIDAAKLYLKEKNIKNIEIYAFDDAWEQEKVEKAYKEAREEGIDIIITSHTSTCGIELKKLTDQEKEDVIVLVTGSTTNKLTGLDDNTIRLIQDVESEQRSLAKHISSFNYDNIILVRDIYNYEYGNPALKFFEENYNGKFTLLDIDIKNVDMKKLEDTIKNTDHDAVYTLIGGNQTISGTIAQLAYQKNKNVKIYFTPWNNATTIVETAGEAIDSCVMSNHYPFRRDSEGVEKYLTDFDEEYGYAPTYNSLHVYKTMEILDEAIINGNKKPMEIKKYIIEKGKFETQFGETIVNENGDTDMDLYFIENFKDAFK